MALESIENGYYLGDKKNLVKAIFWNDHSDHIVVSLAV